MNPAASATFLPGNTPLIRNVRRLRSVIAMPPDFNHLMHLSHRPLGLLFGQPLPQTVQHIRQARLRRHQFGQLAVYGIEIDIRVLTRFAGMFRLSKLFPESAIKPGCGRQVSDHRSEEREPWQSETPAMMVRALA